MPIRVEQDDRIRAVGSVLLLTDVIKMNDYWKHPAVKQLSLEHVTPYRDHPCAQAAREIDPTRSMGAAFNCFAIQLNFAEGRFTATSPPSSYGEEFGRLGFADLLSDFYNAAGLASFWESTADLWEETVTDCRNMLAEEDPGVFLSVFYGDIAGDLVVVPSPLNPTSFGYGPRAGRTAYAIIGPPNVARESPDPVRYLHFGHSFQDCIFHEFSHSLLNLAEDSAPDVAGRLYTLFGSMPTNTKFRDIYDHIPNRMWFDELVIRAATALYEKEMGREDEATAFLRRQEDEYGLGWIGPVYESLSDYLIQRKAGVYSGLDEYLPVLDSLFRDRST